MNNNLNQSNQPQKVIKIHSTKRFTLGLAIGLFLAAIVWSYSAYFQVSISLVRGVIGSLLLAVFCGAIASFGNLDKLMDNLPHL